MGPLTEQEEWIPEDNEVMMLSKEIDDNFSRSVGDVKKGLLVNINWGVKDLDRDGVGTWDPEDVGKLIWDDSFTMTPEANQRSILDLCNKLKTDSSDLVKEPNEVECWIDDMNELLPANGKLPISNAAQFEQALKNFAENTERGRKHVGDYNLGFEKSNGKIKWMRIVVPSFGDPNESAKQKEPHRDKWNKFVDDYVATAPDTLKNVYQEANGVWAWMRSEQAFYDGVFQGVSISAVLAFSIMIISTQNILIATYAIISVLWIVLTVVGIMVMNGYELGVSESIAMVIIIGFSVDYVVHLGAHYVHKKSPDRTDRTSDALGAMGVSIFSGAVTTFGSGVFLFGGHMIFFQKFALIITTTVAVSLIYAMVYFVAFLHAFGPERE